MHNTYSEITNNKAGDDDPAFEASFCARYQARPATRENLSAVTVLDLLQKRTVQVCGRFNPVTGASAPPPSCFLFANRAPPPSRSRPDDVPRPPEACRRPRLASPSRTAPLPTSTRGPCPNYDCTSRSARSKSFPPYTSSMSTSPLVASPTSATHNRTWMPTPTPIRNRTSA